VFNAGDTAVDFALPVPSPAMQWLLVFDTGDSVSSEQLRSADSAGVTIAARSSVLLEQGPAMSARGKDADRDAR
jgi:hypothetical protein